MAEGGDSFPFFAVTSNSEDSPPECGNAENDALQLL